MVQPYPSPDAEWLTLACPFCRARFRIRTADAHLRGRCPECAYRIEPPRPRPAGPRSGPASDADEPLGLVPAEDEWTGASRPEEDEPAAHYGLSAAPTWEGPPPTGPTAGPGATREPPEDPYSVNAPDGLDAPAEPALLYQLNRNELDPARAPEPPARPLWQGVYTFPWRLENLGTWLFLALDLDLVLLVAVLMPILGPLTYNLSYPFMIPFLAIGGLWTGLYAASHFQTILEETAAGNDRFPRCDWSVPTGLLRLCVLLWLGACGVLPCLIVAGLGVPGYVVPMPAVALFPVFLLSALASDSVWSILNGRILRGLARKPSALFAAWVPAYGLALVCVLVPLWAVLLGYWWLLPVTGPVWSACLLIYARLLGRVAWSISLGDVRKKKKKSPQKEPAAGVERPHEEQQVSGWG